MNQPPEVQEVPLAAIGYVYSAKAGAEGAAKVDAGRRAVMLFAAQQGLRLVACEADMGPTCRIARRAVRKAMAHGWPHILLLPALPHLSRNVAVAAKIIDRLLARGQHVVTCDGQLDSRTRPGRLMLGMLEALCKLENETNAARLH